MKLYLFILFLLLSICLPIFADTPVSGSITTDTTWGKTYPDPNGTYIVTGDIIIRNQATLSIESGVTVKFNSNTGIYVGGTGLNDTGKIVANGTTDEPIIFTANQLNPSPGNYKGIYFRDYADDTSMLNFVRIQYGGYYNNANIVFDSSSPDISNCWVSYSSNYGIFCKNNANPNISNCTISNNNSYGIYCFNNSSPIIENSTISQNSTGIYSNNSSTPIIRNNTFDNNSSWPILIYPNAAGNIYNNTFLNTPADYAGIKVFGGTLSLDSTWHYNPLPFYVSGTITIAGQDGDDQITTLTIEPGTTLKFANNMSLYVGNYDFPNYPGKLIAVGTNTNKITFTRWGNSGYWYGIYFTQNSSDDSLLNNCIVEYGGGGNNAYNANISIRDSSTKLVNTLIRYSNKNGVTIRGTAAPILHNCTVTNSQSVGIYIIENSNTTISNCYISNNSNVGVKLANNASVLMTNSTIRANNYYGAYITNLNNNATINGCNFENNNGYPIRAYAKHIRNFHNNSFNNNTNQMIYVDGSTIELDSFWENPGIPYKISNSISVEGQDGDDNVTSLTIQAGSILRFVNGGISIGRNQPGALIVPGTSSNTVEFTTDSNNPAPGQWIGIYFYSNTNDNLTRLEYCKVKYAGSTLDAYGIYLDNASPTIINCEISYSRGYGLRIRNGSNPQIYLSHIHHNNQSGIEIVDSSPIIESCNISFNSENGIYNNGSSNSVIRSNTINNNQNYGILISIYHPEINPIIAYNSINNNGSYPIKCLATHLNNIYANSFSGNNPQKILVDGTAIRTNMTWHYQPIPILFRTSPSVLGSNNNIAILTIEQGLTIQLMASLYIGSSDPSEPGGILVNGSPNHKVIFTKNDAPNSSNWGGLQIQSAVDEYCIIQNAIFEYGGRDTSGCITIVNCSPTLRFVEVRNNIASGISISNSNALIYSCYIHDNNQIAGITCYSAGSTPYIQHCVITNNSTGILTIDVATPIIGGSPGLGNNFSGNDYAAQYNILYDKTCVNATYNYWGSPTGPYDPSNAIDHCVNDYHYGGGDYVSDYFNYLNYLSAPIPTPTQPPEPTFTPTATPTPTFTPTPSLTPTSTLTPTPSPTPFGSPSPTPTPTITPTPPPLPSLLPLALIITIFLFSIFLAFIPNNSSY